MKILVLFLLIPALAAGISLTEMKEIFQHQVSSLAVDQEYEAWARETAILSLESRVNAAQFFVLVDRSARQKIMIGLFCPQLNEVEIIGWDRVSTGDPTQPDRFHTPVGIFHHSVSIIGWRSTGEPNEAGWVAYGPAGARVWDFGWQKTDSGRSIRLALHATDPRGEDVLGQPASRGCIRISVDLNWFLDYFGILDAEYQENLESAWVQWILMPESRPVTNAGQYLIVTESK